MLCASHEYLLSSIAKSGGHVKGISLSGIWGSDLGTQYLTVDFVCLKWYVFAYGTDGQSGCCRCCSPHHAAGKPQDADFFLPKPRSQTWPKAPTAKKPGQRKRTDRVVKYCVPRFILIRETGLTEEQLIDELTGRGGLLGISGVSGDMRDLWAAVDQGNKRARLAIDAYVYGIKKTIGAYAAAMGGMDALNFTGGIGERDPRTRSLVCQGLEFLGIKLDPQRNKASRNFISSKSSKVYVTVIPADEEWVLAGAAMEYLKGKG